MDIKEATTLARMLDKAIMSDSEEVKSMLNELLMVVALTDRTKEGDGPFARQKERIDDLDKKLHHTTDQLQRLTREIQRHFSPGYGERGFGSSSSSRSYRDRVFEDDMRWRDSEFRANWNQDASKCNEIPYPGSTGLGYTAFSQTDTEKVMAALTKYSIDELKKK